MTPPAKSRGAKFLLVVLFSGLSSAPNARADMAESGVRFPTDTYAPHLFTLNPGAQKPESTKAGILLQTHNRTSKLDQSPSGDDELESVTRVLRENAGGQIYGDQDRQYFSNELSLVDRQRGIPQ